jgi:hypothetical protein
VLGYPGFAIQKKDVGKRKISTAMVVASHAHVGHVH